MSNSILRESVGCDMTESCKTQMIGAHVLNELLDYIEDNVVKGQH